MRAFFVEVVRVSGQRLEHGIGLPNPRDRLANSSGDVYSIHTSSMPALPYQFGVTLADQLLDTSLLPLDIHERLLHIPVLVSRRRGHIARFVKLPGLILSIPIIWSVERAEDYAPVRLARGKMLEKFNG